MGTRFSCIQKTQFLVLAAVVFVIAAAGCPSKQTSDMELAVELGMAVPLWVQMDCRKGRPVFKEYSVLKMPEEKVVWTLAKLDKTCRIYGAIVPKTQKKVDKCDIRLRSKKPVVRKGRCRCVPGRYDLQEGRPTSKYCCKRYPNKVYCKEKLKNTKTDTSRTDSGRSTD